MTENHRMVHLEYAGLVLRRQPPVRVEYCQTPHPLDPAKFWLQCATCLASSESCPRCRFSYCPSHMREHVRRFAAPPDAWKTVTRKLLFRWRDVAGPAPFFLTQPEQITTFAPGGRLVSPRPPARVEFCVPPTSGKVDLPCAHQSKACQPGSTACPRCVFTFCPKHSVSHTRAFAWPMKDWQAIVEQFRKEKAKAAQNRRHGVYVEVTRLIPVKKKPEPPT